MVKHIILWTLKDELSENEKEEVKKGIKEGLEGLKGKIPGMTDIQVRIDKLASSNVDVMLDSSFESEEALTPRLIKYSLIASARSFESGVRARPHSRGLSTFSSSGLSVSLFA